MDKPPPAQITIDTTLSHYTIIAKIGAGGRGEVYRARDPRLDREGAIKLLQKNLTQRRSCSSDLKIGRRSDLVHGGLDFS